MAILRVMIRDARGQRVPLVPLSPLLAFRGDQQRIARLRAASRYPRAPVTAREVWRGLGYGLLALPALLVPAVAPVGLTFWLRAPWWVLIPATLLIGTIPALVTVWLTRRIAADRIARLYLRAGYCASCAYDLQGTLREPDGCRYCPECGAAWRSEAT